jgi:hypothetical protein
MMIAMGTASRRAGVALMAFVAVLFLQSAAAAAKSYTAERFDSVVRVLPDGTLDVTETVVFRFEDGTFREVFREIPDRRTDGIEIVRAEMQGQRLPFGNEPGTVEIRRRSNRTRVVWRFGPIEGVTRAFVLNYRVQGAIRQTPEGDVLHWRGLPGEHRYSIESTSIRFELPMAPSVAPAVDSRKAGTPRTSIDGTVVLVQSSDVRRNGWIETALQFPPRAVATEMPAWQQRAVAASAHAGSWMIGGGAVLLAGLVVLVAWRQSYDTPPRELDGRLGQTQQPEPPDSLAPAIGGVLAGNGRVGIEHAMAALFALADRGEIEIQEKPKGAFGQHDFLLIRRGLHDLTGYDGAVVDTIFKGESPQVTLSQARTRLTWKFQRFSRAVARALSEGGLVEESRQAIKRRYNRAGIGLLAAGSLGVVPAALLNDRHGAWPLAIPGALLALAVCAFIFGAATTPLSNDGVRRAARWRDYRRHLRSVAQGKRSPAGIALSGVLPFAVALGLADVWSAFLKKQGFTVPNWYHALPSNGGHSAFPAFIATSGASASSGGAGGGAAGGGASGAG